MIVTFLRSIVWMLHTLARRKAIEKIRIFNHANVLQSFTSYEATVRLFHGSPICTVIEILQSLPHSSYLKNVLALIPAAP